ncbi:MAG TPA: methylthioribulose 1-phosphate dehydratase [Gammaproteobacteria bacterium]
MDSELQHYTQELIEAGRWLSERGLVPATSGNLSARLGDGRIAITVSGRHKGHLRTEDILCADAEGASLDQRRPSAETLLHVQIYRRFPDARVVLHPHSLNATVLSRLCTGAVLLEGYELVKAFPGIDTHENSLSVPVFENDQDIKRLARKVDRYMETDPSLRGYLIRGHGFYTWGDSTAAALRHVEAFEFMFACELKLYEVRKQ